MPKDKPKLNLHKAGDMGEMKSILATDPAGPPSDEIDAAFMHSLPIETLLQNPGLHRSYRCGMLTGKKDRYGREEFRRIRIRVNVSGDLMGEFRKASEIGFCDCKVPVFHEHLSLADNPDTAYCPDCLKLVHRDQQREIVNPKEV